MVDTLWRGGLCTTASCSRKLPISDYFKNSHYRVAEATLSGAWIMGNAFAFSGDFNKALNAAKRVFQLLDRYVDFVDAGRRITNSSGSLRLTQTKQLG